MEIDLPAAQVPGSDLPELRLGDQGVRPPASVDAIDALRIAVLVVIARHGQDADPGLAQPAQIAQH